MSLLQEALKRKENDENPAAGGAPETIHLSVKKVSPPAAQQAEDNKGTAIPESFPAQSMPVTGQTQTATSQIILAKGGPGRRKTSLMWIIVAVIAVFIGLTVPAGVAFFLYRYWQPIKAKTAQHPYHIGQTGNVSGGTATATGRLMPAAAQKTTDESNQFAAPDGKDAKKDSIAMSAYIQATATIQNTEASAVQPQSPGGAENKTVSAKSRLRRDEPVPPMIKAPPAPSPDARWPALKLTGILRGPGGVESTAFINGNMVRAGQTIEDVTVVKIQADGVLLKYGAEKKFLRVGATLY